MGQKLIIENKATKRFEAFLTDLLIDKIKTIQQATQTPWFDPVGGVKNLQGRPYSGVNEFILTLGCNLYKWETPVFTTLKMANAENISILKGAKSLPVLRVLNYYKNKLTKEFISEVEFNSLGELDKEEYSPCNFLKGASVFNIDQTNIREVRPDLYENVVAEYKKSVRDISEGENNRIDDLIQSQTWFCPIITDLRDKAYYSLSSNEIHLPSKSRFKSDELFYSTLLHELTHSTGHPDLLDRLNLSGSTFGSPKYAKEELIAELGAALTGVYYNQPVSILEDHASYLKSWLKVLQEEPEFLHTVLQDSTKASKMIITRIDTQEQYLQTVQIKGQDNAQETSHQRIDYEEGIFNKNGERHGVWRWYYEDGTLEHEVPYENDKCHGISRWYYPDGTLESEIPYENGKPHGIARGYLENGFLWYEPPYKNGKRHGTAREYALDGVTITKEIEYKNDKMVKVTEGWELEAKRNREEKQSKGMKI